MWWLLIVKGVVWAKKVYAASVDTRPDIVLVSAHPAYFDFWQATKPITVATCLVKPGDGSSGYALY